MKILAVSNLYPPHVIGGYELVCANVMGALLRRGHQVMVATSPSHVSGPPGPGDVRRCLQMSAHIPEYLTPPHKYHPCDISDFSNVAALQRLLLEFIPDVVVLWNTHGIGTLHLIDFLNDHGVPWCFYLADFVYSQMINAAPAHARAVFRGDDPGWFASGGIMSMSQRLVDEITTLGDFAFPHPPVIVHGCVDIAPDRFARGPRRATAMRFMAAGRVSEAKGVTLICDAAARLVAAGIGDFTIDIYGEGDVAFFVNHVAALGLAARVMFHGAVSQEVLYEHFQTHDMFLFPTWNREPFGLVPLEAAAFGCVPILTEDCGCAERIVDGVHGIKIARTAQSLAEAMARAINGEIDLNRMAIASAAMVRGDMSLDGHVEKLLDVLQSQLRPWDMRSLTDPRALPLAFMKHHLSLALLAGATD